MKTELFRDRVRVGSLFVVNGKAMIDSEEYAGVQPFLEHISPGESFHDGGSIVFRRRQMNDDEVLRSAKDIPATIGLQYPASREGAA